MKKRKLMIHAGITVILFSAVYIYCHGSIFNKIFSSKKETREPEKPFYVHGIHLTSWAAGSKKIRAKIDPYLGADGLNTLVIDAKEEGGEVYIPGVMDAEKYRAYTKSMPDIENFLKQMKLRGIYTVARVVTFRDAYATAANPSLAVKKTDGTLWKDYKGSGWLDPYNRGAWEYIISVATRCAEIGFDEVQFDYVRFPSDGNVKNCVYSQKHSSITAMGAIAGFLKEANTRIKKSYKAKTSIDVFGLTGSVEHDMGIGQSIVEMGRHVDYICPMVYPSHYNKGELKIPDPNAAPYDTVYRSLKNAAKKLGPDWIKLRPYLQDFSLGHRYTIVEVVGQIEGAYDNNIFGWTLWNPRIDYHFDIFNQKDIICDYSLNVDTPPAAPASTNNQK